MGRIGDASFGDANFASEGWSIEPDGDDATDREGEDAGDLDGEPDGETDEGDEGEARQRVRLQRVLADAGVSARRHAEALIEEGRVTVNGETVRELPCFVDPHFDRILVDSRPIPKPARHVYVMFHKPERVLVTDADEPGLDRRTLRDFVQHPGAPRLFAIGRLDYQTTGVVIMTNDGDLANRVSHPRANLSKTYHLVIKGSPTPQNMRILMRTAAHADKARAKTDQRESQKRRTHARSPLEIRVIASDPGKSLLEVTTRDERNLDLRGACLAAGLPVKRISRISYGPIRLTALPLGNWRELTRQEVNALKKAARLAKAGRASPPPAKPGVDFSNLPAEKLAALEADQVGTESARPTGPVARDPGERTERRPTGLAASKVPASAKTPASPKAPARPTPARAPSARDHDGPPGTYRPRVIR